MKKNKLSINPEKEDIAVIGMSGMFPNAKNLEVFWNNLESGTDSIREIPADRWNKEETKIKWGGFIEDVDKFDAAFFTISPKEAELMDPQQRLFLQSAWAALEDAGYGRKGVAGTKTGVFVGVASNDYANSSPPQGVRRRMKLRPEEITSILRQRIEEFDVETNLAEVGAVLQLGAGIARVHGLENCVALELLELDHGVVGIAFNLE